jgi:hypothetical protein
LKVRPEQPTQDELNLASGRNKLDASAADAYISDLKKASENIVEAFNRQAVQAQVSFFRILFLNN